MVCVKLRISLAMLNVVRDLLGKHLSVRHDDMPVKLAYPVGMWHGTVSLRFLSVLAGRRTGYASR